jgi:RHS repeat-associated protein
VYDFDDLSLNYMQARYYDPVIGRFYSNDPVGVRDVHSFNRYAYVNNNPYKYTDPDGRTSEVVNGIKAKPHYATVISNGKGMEIQMGVAAGWVEPKREAVRIHEMSHFIDLTAACSKQNCTNVYARKGYIVVFYDIIDQIESELKGYDIETASLE